MDGRLKRRKSLRFHKYPDTCGQGLSTIHLPVTRQPRSQGFSLEGGWGGKSPGNEVGHALESMTNRENSEIFELKFVRMSRKLKRRPVSKRQYAIFIELQKV